MVLCPAHHNSLNDPGCGLVNECCFQRDPGRDPIELVAGEVGERGNRALDIESQLDATVGTGPAQFDGVLAATSMFL